MTFRSLMALLCILLAASPALAKRKKHAVRHKKAHVVQREIPVPVGPFSTSDISLILTFDDGPHLENTPKILDILDKQGGIKAIFFVNGYRFSQPNQSQARAMLLQILKRGHVVGNHTVNHPEPRQICGVPNGFQKAEKEVQENAQLILDATHIKPPFFRTPFGSSCATWKEVFAAHGMNPIRWDIDSNDWAFKDAEKSLAYVEQQLQKFRGYNKPLVILFHDTKPETVTTVSKLLDWLKQQKNIKFAHPAELLPEEPLVGAVRRTWHALQQATMRIVRIFG